MGCPQDFELFGLETEKIFKKAGNVSSCLAYKFTSIMEIVIVGLKYSC